MVGATVLNIAQNGGNVHKIDAFDIATSTLNPYGGLSGSIGMAGINSLVDYNPFAASGNQFSTLGNGKNIFQVGFDFSFSSFGEGVKFTYGTLGGTNGVAGMFTDIVTGNAGTQVQDLARDNK